SFTAAPKEAQQGGQIGLNAHLLDELGIRLDPLLLCHDRWVRETVVWVDECPGDRILGPWLVHRAPRRKTIAGLGRRMDPRFPARRFVLLQDSGLELGLLRRV